MSVAKQIPGSRRRRCRTRSPVKEQIGLLKEPVFSFELDATDILLLTEQLNGHLSSIIDQ